MARFPKPRKSRQRPWRRAAAQEAAPAPTPSSDPVRALFEEAKILDSLLEGAREELASLHIPSLFGLWLAQFPIDQLGNDDLVEAYESYLAHLRDAVHSFVGAVERLEPELQADLDDASMGPASLRALIEDPRLSSRPRPAKREALVSFLKESRTRTARLVEEVQRQGARAYR